MTVSECESIKDRISWRSLLFAFLPFSFLRSIIFPDSLTSDIGWDINNPTLFFIGYLSAAIISCVILLFCKPVRTWALRYSFIVSLTFLVLATVITYIGLIANIGDPWVLLIGGIGTGVASALVFIQWYAVFATMSSRIYAPTIACSFIVAYILVFLYSFLPSNPSLAVGISFIAVFISALPLGLQKNKPDIRAPKEQPSLSSAIPLKTVLSSAWPLLAAVFIAYMINGFAWGNALFDAVETPTLSYSLMTFIGKCLGAGFLLFQALTNKHSLHGLSSMPFSSWIIPLAVGLILASWLISDGLGGWAMWAAYICTGFALGLLDTTLVAWICYRGAGDPESTWKIAAIGCTAIVLPVALGIYLSPVVHGEVAMLFTPLCAVIFFIVYYATRTKREREDTALASQENLLEMSGYFGLSARETDVFVLLAHGYSSGYIAERLGISVQTVQTHTKHIYKKMDVHTKDEFLASLAAERQ